MRVAGSNLGGTWATRAEKLFPSCGADTRTGIPGLKAEASVSKVSATIQTFARSAIR